MRKEYVLTSVVSAVIGAGLMLLAVGGSKPAGIEGWVPLNAEVASALQAEQAPAGGGSAAAGAGASAAAHTGDAGKADQRRAAQGMDTAGGRAAAGGAAGTAAGGAAAGGSAGGGAAAGGAAVPGAAPPAGAALGEPAVGSPAAGNPAAGSPASSAAPPQQADTSLISINQAGLTELQDIPGIGEKKAQAIIDYRTAHGPFVSLSDLTKVKGVGNKMLEKMKPYIRL
ncbi:ComEA family DNA-binding protein [Paenibacillus macerans]|uniref:ComEA family DNA-binding protein n=2 Tax=Paenibacillus macerans TaxID=44252 RepID=UPI0022E29D9F|nr:ComEA family DNA-binding protein [Paenibacillus macerans]